MIYEASNVVKNSYFPVCDSVRWAVSPKQEVFVQIQDRNPLTMRFKCHQLEGKIQTNSAKPL